MTRVKANIDICNYHHHQLSTVQSGNLKAARMFFSVAAGKLGSNNDRWWRTLQNFSDYLIRY